MARSRDGGTEFTQEERLGLNSQISSMVWYSYFCPDEQNLGRINYARLVKILQRVDITTREADRELRELRAENAQLKSDIATVRRVFGTVSGSD